MLHKAAVEAAAAASEEEEQEKRKIYTKYARRRDIRVSGTTQNGIKQVTSFYLCCNPF
jgi:hypothetical protein